MELGKVALYRKYRSRSLDEVIGQNHVTSVLASAIKGGQFSHAYLLTGPRGIGKTSVARIVAHLINQLPYDEHGHIDIIEIDAASNTGVDNIRDLRDKANIAPTSAKYKVYIIDEVHMLSTGAFNALLKTLEEPPSHVIFILATTEVQKLPATILSRTQRFHFRPVSLEQATAHLKKIAAAEKIKIDEAALKLIAERGEGSLRDSISLLDQLSGLDKKVEASDVEDILGLAPEPEIEALAEALTSKNAPEVVKILNRLKVAGLNPAVTIQQLTNNLLTKTEQQPRLYELIEKLLEAPKSANPYLKMMAILAGYASDGGRKTMPQVVEPAVRQVKQTYESLVDDQPAPKKAKKSPAPAAGIDPETEVPEIAATTEPPKTIDWENVVAEAVKLNPPYGSLIGNASIDYDAGKLTLYFRQKIYRDKMNQPRCREVLEKALTNLYDNPPKFSISDSPKPKNDKLAKIADIMGGGEII